MIMRTGFFQEKNGDRSMMRLIAYQSWWAAFVYGIPAVLYGSDAAMQLVWLFFSGGVLGKLGQKFMEVKKAKEEPKG